jgi:DNA-binding Lrp family transcriptional regulator
MRTPRRATALLLTGGVALASVAYAIGSESGDGSAVADSPSSERVGFKFPDDRLADELGVEPSELRKALQDFHDQHAEQRRSDFADALADALGKSGDDVRSALEQLAGDRQARFARQLADELGIDAGKVRAALDDLRDDRPIKPFGFAAALAGKLGVDASDVEDALRALRPRLPLHKHHGREPLRQLADALDVTRAELRKALRELRGDLGSKIEEHRAELVSFLAERFGLSEGEVEEALPEFPRPPHGLGERFQGPGEPPRPGLRRFRGGPDGTRPGMALPAIPFVGP